MFSSRQGILLTGGSGKLGSALRKSGRFESLLAPSHEDMDIADWKSVQMFCQRHDFDAVIHCAALTKMGECERNPMKALAVNVEGTANLVRAAAERQERQRRTVRFVHISTDGVYPGSRGHYAEGDETIPYNRYGWTKLGAECVVRLLSDFCIIRTSFFDPAAIPFEESPVDSFSSKVTLDHLVQAIEKILRHKFVGVINIGDERQSYYERYRMYKPSVRPCKLDEVRKTLPFPIARDSSMNCELWRKLCAEDAAPAADTPRGG